VEVLVATGKLAVERELLVEVCIGVGDPRGDEDLVIGVLKGIEEAKNESSGRFRPIAHIRFLIVVLDLFTSGPPVASLLPTADIRAHSSLKERVDLNILKQTFLNLKRLSLTVQGF
jgi:hypothetical protein